MKRIRIGAGLGFYGDRGSRCARASSVAACTTSPATIWPNSRSPSCRRTARAMRASATRATWCRCSARCGRWPRRAACASCSTPAGSIRAAPARRSPPPSPRKAGARIATVTGDDVLPHLDALQAAGETLAHLDSGAPLAEVRDRLVFANAYLGAAPIVRALAKARTSSSPAASPMRRCSWRRSCTSSAGRSSRATRPASTASRRASSSATCSNARARAAAATSARWARGRSSGPDAHRLPDRRGRGRRRRAHHQGAGHGRAHRLRHAAPATALRGARPAALSRAQRRARHGRAAPGRPRRRPRARARRDRACAARAPEDRRRLRRRLDGPVRHRLQLARRAGQGTRDHPLGADPARRARPRGR